MNSMKCSAIWRSVNPQVSTATTKNPSRGCALTPTANNHHSFAVLFHAKNANASHIWSAAKFLSTESPLAWRKKPKNKNSSSWISVKYKMHLPTNFKAQGGLSLRNAALASRINTSRYLKKYTRTRSSNFWKGRKLRSFGRGYNCLLKFVICRHCSLTNTKVPSKEF